MVNRVRVRCSTASWPGPVSFPQLPVFRGIGEGIVPGQDLVLHVTPHKNATTYMHCILLTRWVFCQGLIKQDNDLGGYFLSAHKYFLTLLAATVLDLGRPKSGIEVMCNSVCVCVCVCVRECVCLCSYYTRLCGWMYRRACS